MRLEDITSGFGGTSLVSGIYPGWKYRVDSPLREKMMRIFKEMYSNEPKVEAIHAGLECGFFVSKNEKLDAVSIGPDMQDIHSPSERLSISSTARTYEYLLKILAAH
jgi:dipeptidase D